jgi:hypothetical protein
MSFRAVEDVTVVGLLAHAHILAAARDDVAVAAAVVAAVVAVVMPVLERKD